MQIHCPRLPHILAAPDIFINGFPVQCNIPVSDKQEQKVKFLHGKGNCLPVSRYLSGCRINQDIKNLKTVFRLVIPSEHRLHSRQQLHNFKRLCQIIVCPHFQPLYLILCCSKGGQKDNRNHQFSCILHQLISVNSRQHHIQQNQIYTFPLHQVSRLLSIRCPDTVISGTA